MSQGLTENATPKSPAPPEAQNVQPSPPEPTPPAPTETAPPNAHKAAAPKPHAFPQKKTTSPDSRESYAGKVVVIPVGEKDLLSSARFQFMSRTLKRASAEQAEAVIFDLNTPGGLAWDTTTFIMQDLQELDLKSFAFVNPRALSAGALISIGTDAIYMSPASSIGAATPVNSTGEAMGEDERAKMNSAIMAMSRAVAARKGHNPAILDAMIDKDVGLKIGDKQLSEKGRILTLTADEAVAQYDGKPLLAKAIVSSLEELVAQEKLSGELVKAEPQGFEFIAILISQWAPILLMVGIVCGYIEMQHPGFGLPGIVAILAFSLFFFGHYVAGSLVGYELIALFVVGVILLIVEFFVLPGIILPGLLGMICIGIALVLTMASWDFATPEEGTSWMQIPWAFLLTAMLNFAIAVVGSMVLSALVIRFLPESRAFAPMILASSLEGAGQATIDGQAAEAILRFNVGMKGVTMGALRPYGTVKFGEEQTVAKSEKAYLNPDQAVEIIHIHQGTIVVRELS